MSNPRQNTVVSREYRPVPDACIRALQSLLDRPVTKTAAESTPDPDAAASVKHEEEVSHVEQRTR
jgi:hypothetical protein